MKFLANITYIPAGACKNSKHQLYNSNWLVGWLLAAGELQLKNIISSTTKLGWRWIYKIHISYWKFLSVFVSFFKFAYDGKYLSVRKWMIGLTLLTDNTKITTKNRGKNKFQPAFNVKVYLQTKTDKIILSRSITGLLTPNIFFHGILYHPPTSYTLPTPTETYISGLKCI